MAGKFFFRRIGFWCGVPVGAIAIAFSLSAPAHAEPHEGACLRAQQAQRDAEFARAQYEAAQRSVAEKVREACFNLFYLRKASAVLVENRAELDRVERITETGYRVGRGNQQDVSKAQLQLTQMLREIEMNREQIDEQQADLKAIIGRETDTRDIEIGEIKPSAFDLDTTRIRALAAAT